MQPAWAPSHSPRHRSISARSAAVSGPNSSPAASAAARMRLASCEAMSRRFSAAAGPSRPAAPRAVSSRPSPALTVAFGPERAARSRKRGNKVSLGDCKRSAAATCSHSASTSPAASPAVCGWPRGWALEGQSGAWHQPRGREQRNGAQVVFPRRPASLRPESAVRRRRRRSRHPRGPGPRGPNPGLDGCRPASQGARRALRTRSRPLTALPGPHGGPERAVTRSRRRRPRRTAAAAASRGGACRGPAPPAHGPGRDG